MVGFFQRPRGLPALARRQGESISENEVGETVNDGDVGAANTNQAAMRADAALQGRAPEVLAVSESIEVCESTSSTANVVRESAETTRDEDSRANLPLHTEPMYTEITISSTVEEVMVTGEECVEATMTTEKTVLTTFTAHKVQAESNDAQANQSADTLRADTSIIDALDATATQPSRTTTPLQDVEHEDDSTFDATIAEAGLNDVEYDGLLCFQDTVSLKPTSLHIQDIQHLVDDDQNSMSLHALESSNNPLNDDFNESSNQTLYFKMRPYSRNGRGKRAMRGVTTKQDKDQTTHITAKSLHVEASEDLTFSGSERDDDTENLAEVTMQSQQLEANPPSERGQRLSAGLIHPVPIAKSQNGVDRASAHSKSSCNDDSELLRAVQIPQSEVAGLEGGSSHTATSVSSSSSRKMYWSLRQKDKKQLQETQSSTPLSPYSDSDTTASSTPPSRQAVQAKMKWLKQAFTPQGGGNMTDEVLLDKSGEISPLHIETVSPTVPVTHYNIPLIDKSGDDMEWAYVVWYRKGLLAWQPLTDPLLCNDIK
jgi:hypothetical protein